MNTHSAAASRSGYLHASRPDERESPEATDARQKSGWAPRLAPCIAFFVMVFASMAAAATVVSEAPLMLVGLY